MIRTVEGNKTLLVDGPASVTVISGKVKVFGFRVNSTNRIVIREGKRLPFAVEEKATFNISLGENANVEEIDGDTIPESWDLSFEKLAKIQTKPVTAMVLGTVDSGKTSFCTYLINRLLYEKQKIAILDGDLGQSDIGPPCTLAYTFITKPVTDLFNLQAKNAFFVGVTSPSVATNKVIQGLTALKEEVLFENPDFIILNTDGWIEGEEALNYKLKLVEEINPHIVFAIQQENEVLPLLSAVEKFKPVVVESPSAIKQRSREKRKSLRELGYAKYLRNAKVQSLPLSWIKIEENDFWGLSRIHESTPQARKIYELLGMRPLHLTETKDAICIIIGKGRWINKDNIRKAEEYAKKRIIVFRKGEEEGLLTALYDAEKRFLGIGVLQEIDYIRKNIKILTSVTRQTSTVAFGKVKLDKNFKEIPALTEENSLDLSKIKNLF